MTCLLLSRDAWRIIAEHLTIQDLLALRRCCKKLNVVVKSMSDRWYRAWQWFVIRYSNASKVRSAVKQHTTRVVTPYCIDINHKKIPVELRRHTNFNTFNLRNNHIKKLIEDGELTELDCCHAYHWSYVTPKTEQDIPLDDKYKPKRNKYIYWYLIECYRHFSRRHCDSLAYHENTLTSMKRQIEQTKLMVQRQERELPILEQRLKQQQAMYKDNDVFGKTRINGYKGV